MAQTKVKSELIDGGLGTDWQSTIQTSNFTAAAGKGYFVNTTSGAITVTLPAGVVGEEIILQDYARTFDTNKITITANGSEKIQGGTSDKVCNTENALVRLVYQDATQGWTGNNIAADIAVVNYLVIAGGGGGTLYNGGGGGAGGYRASYNSEASGGGGSSETELTLNGGTNYTVTVGAGGTSNLGTNANYNRGVNGNDSVFATITSLGGGAGGARATNGPGQDGGSGGGGAGGGGAGTSSFTMNSGTANTGGGGGSGAMSGTAQGGLGGSGVVILRYSNTKTITIGSGLTGTTATVGSDKVTTFTAGTGNIQIN